MCSEGAPAFRPGVNRMSAEQGGGSRSWLWIGVRRGPANTRRSWLVLGVQFVGDPVSGGLEGCEENFGHGEAPPDLGLDLEGCEAEGVSGVVGEMHGGEGCLAHTAQSRLRSTQVTVRYTCIMQLRYNFRLYPSPGQARQLAQAFGCARVVFNDALHIRKDAHANGDPYPKTGDLSKMLITEAKRTPEREWLSNAPVGVLQQALRDLDTAYRSFFASLSGRRKGPKLGAPRFRSRKDHRQAVRYTRSDRFKVTAGGKLRLPKVGDVKVRWSRALPSEPSSVTVILDAAGRYHASFVVQVDAAPLPPVESEVGVDLGLTSFAVTSSGRVIDNPRYLRNAERRLKRAQQALSRKEKGSRNRGKARVKVARAHAKVADARRDFLHKLSTELVRENQAVYVEDLAVKGLARTRLAKSIHDAGWGMFLTMLEEKATRYGRTFTRVDRWFPSSQICSTCGHRDGPKPLSVRSWTCPACGTRHDRDENAARNILTEGRRTAAGRAAPACGGDTRPDSCLANPSEAGTHRSPA
jgi:putative transposase